MIYIRADANPNIGMGHIMRCLSIADAFTSAENSVCFVLADDTVQSLVQSRGYETIILHSDYRAMDAELSFWPYATIKLVIVDSYFVTANYLRSLQNRMKESGGKLIYLDDVYAFPYPVDVLINYNAYASQSSYIDLYRDSTVPQLILGPTYAPLRSMFRNIPKRMQKEQVKNILISTGGSDELHLALALLQGIMSKEARGIEYHFLLGAMNADKEKIKKLSKGRDNIVLHENVTDMKSLIESVDLAISAAGSTLYEISACGVPLITYSLADNQIPGAEAFEKLGLAVNVGDLRDPESIDPALVMSGTLSSDAAERILAAAEDLSNDYERRVSMGTRMQELIDGYGGDRTVQRIAGMSENSTM